MATGGGTIPHVGWIVDDKRYTLQQALDMATQPGGFFGWPAPVLERLQRTRQDGLWLSPSAAGGTCFRRRIIEAHEPYWLDPEDEMTPAKGTAWHEFVYDHRNPLHEIRLSMPLKVVLPDGDLVEVTMQGTCDNAENGIVTDYKTIEQVMKFNPESKRREKRRFPEKSHVIQVNLYALMARHNGIDVQGAQVWYRQLVKGGYMGMVEVPLLDTEEAYELACELALPLALYKRDGTLPPPYDEGDEEFYKCRWCPVAEPCRSTWLNR